MEKRKKSRSDQLTATKSGQLAVRLDDETFSQLDGLCARMQRDRSDVARLMLRWVLSAPEPVQFLVLGAWPKGMERHYFHQGCEYMAKMLNLPRGPKLDQLVDVEEEDGDSGQKTSGQ